jgi:hypothetical protein
MQFGIRFSRSKPGGEKTSQMARSSPVNRKPIFSGAPHLLPSTKSSGWGPHPTISQRRGGKVEGERDERSREGRRGREQERAEKAGTHAPKLEKSWMGAGMRWGAGWRRPGGRPSAAPRCRISPPSSPSPSAPAGTPPLPPSPLHPAGVPQGTR